jgi:hypothetical protein
MVLSLLIYRPYIYLLIFLRKQQELTNAESMKMTTLRNIEILIYVVIIGITLYLIFSFID